MNTAVVHQDGGRGVSVYGDIRKFPINFLYQCVTGVCILSLLLTDYLNQNADMFQRTATRLKRKLWWQNVKLWIILIVIILVILIVIISE